MNTEKTWFRPEIQGLRAIAVLLVVWFHTGLSARGAGFLGVDVFFVISGFLITQLLLREHEKKGTISLGRFYSRRARRLFPAALVAIIATLVASRITLPPLIQHDIAADSLWTTFYLANFRFTITGLDYLADSDLPSPLLHFWSLAVEEQFYLFWPILMLGLLSIPLINRLPVRLRWPIATMTILSLGLSIYFTPLEPVAAYYQLPTRAWQLGAGALAAIVVVDHRPKGRTSSVLGWLGLGLILVPTALYSINDLFPGWRATPVVIGALLVLLACNNSRTPGSLLSIRPLVFIGTVSYSLYLWHWPVYVVGRHLVPVNSYGYFAATILFLVALCLAYASYRWIETPFRPAHGGTSSSVAHITGILVLTLLVAGTAILFMRWEPDMHGTGPDQPTPQFSTSNANEPAQWLNDGLELKMLPANLTPDLYEVTSDLPAVYGDGCHLEPDTTQFNIEQCSYGAQSDARDLVLIGDSHAAQWFPAFEEIALRQDATLYSITKSGCPASNLNVIYKGGDYSQCKVWRQSLKTELETLQPFAVIIANHDVYQSSPGVKYSTEEALTAELDFVNEIQALQPSTNIFLLEDTPFPAKNIPLCLSNNMDNVQECSFKDTSHLTSDSYNELLVSTSAKRLLVTDLFCQNGNCPSIVGNTLVFRDSNHITVRYSRLVSPLLEKKLK